MLEIAQADIERHEGVVGDLFAENMRGLCSGLKRDYGVFFDPEQAVEETMALLPAFLPPEGRLLLAHQDGQAVGCICLSQAGPGIAEIKRMYVQPEFRRRGIGNALLDAVIGEARQIGYSTVRLETARFQKEAHPLYRARGFAEIDPYEGVEIPEQFHPYWRFMEMTLE